MFACAHALLQEGDISQAVLVRLIPEFMPLLLQILRQAPEVLSRNSSSAADEEDEEGEETTATGGTAAGEHSGRTAGSEVAVAMFVKQVLDFLATFTQQAMFRNGFTTPFKAMLEACLKYAVGSPGSDSRDRVSAASARSMLTAGAIRHKAVHVCAIAVLGGFNMDPTRTGPDALTTQNAVSALLTHALARYLGIASVFGENPKTSTGQSSGPSNQASKKKTGSDVAMGGVATEENPSSKVSAAANASYVLAAAKQILPLLRNVAHADVLLDALLQLASRAGVHPVSTQIFETVEGYFDSASGNMSRVREALVENTKFSTRSGRPRATKAFYKWPVAQLHDEADGDDGTSGDADVQFHIVLELAEKCAKRLLTKPPVNVQNFAYGSAVCRCLGSVERVRVACCSVVVEASGANGADSAPAASSMLQNKLSLWRKLVRDFVLTGSSGQPKLGQLIIAQTRLILACVSSYPMWLSVVPAICEELLEYYIW